MIHILYIYGMVFMAWFTHSVYIDDFYFQESRRSFGDLSVPGRTASSDQLADRPYWT